MADRGETDFTMRLSGDEARALAQLAEDGGVSQQVAMRQALRLYHQVSARLADGERLSFSGDAARAAAFAGAAAPAS